MIVKKTKFSGKKYMIDFRDHLQQRRRLRAFANKRESERAASMIELLISTGGKILDPELQSWVESVPSVMRDKLEKWGLIAYRGTGKHLTEHLSDWHDSLLAEGNTEKHADLLLYRASRIFEACDCKVWSDIEAHPIKLKLKSMRNGKKGISSQTHNFYVQALKQFGKWMVRNKRATESLLEELPKLNVEVDKRHVRRALNPKEIGLLIGHTSISTKVRNDMTGYERALLYRLALETGLRSSELRSLKVSNFDFNEGTVTVEAGYSKHRREDILPVESNTLRELKDFLANKAPRTKAFKMPVPDKVTRMYKADLKVAGIEYKVDGKCADFHSLRHTFITNIIKAGATIKEAQTLARHSKPELTIKVYSHVEINDTRRVVERLSSFIASPQIVMTGSELPGKKVPKTCQNLRTAPDFGGLRRTKKGFEGEQKDGQARPKSAHVGPKSTFLG